MAHVDNIRKNFILVAEITTGCVKIIVEGPDEKMLISRQLDNIDLATECKTNELFKQYSPDIYDLIRTRALDINDLKNDFPEFSGWDQAAREQISLI